MKAYQIRDIDPQFWARVRQKSRMENRRVREIILESLEKWLQEPASAPRKRKRRPKVVHIGDRFPPQQKPVQRLPPVEIF